MHGLQVHNSLRKLGRRDEVTLYLTSHCPEIPAYEKADLMRDHGLTRQAFRTVRKKLLEVDLAAFSSADRLVFPCEEAMEPYLETFLLTGLESPQTDRSRITLPAGHGRLKAAYVGRHNKVKGYDFISRVVPPLLDRFTMSLYAAGKEVPLRGPKHPHWHEFGWITNAPDLVANADVLLLPNTRTYFDLVALEAMAIGVPILALRTGGNKRLGEMSPGVMLFDMTEESFTAALQRFVEMTPDQRAELGRYNRAAYHAYFTTKKFAEDYIHTIVEKQDRQHRVRNDIQVKIVP
jgi:glycosyltransferase involved in cell wall biosynthesis